MTSVEAILTPRMLAELAEALRDGALLADAEWLTARRACLVAGECSRSELDRAAGEGWISKARRGSAVLYSRTSIETAIADGLWKPAKR